MSRLSVEWIEETDAYVLSEEGEKIHVSIFGKEVPASIVDSNDEFVAIMLDDSSLVFQLTLVEFNRCCRYAD